MGYGARMYDASGRDITGVFTPVFFSVLTRRLRVMSIMEIHHRVKHYGITWWVQRTGKERQAVHLQYPFLEGPRRGTAWTPACHELFFSSVPNYVWNANC